MLYALDEASYNQYDIKNDIYSPAEEKYMKNAAKILTGLLLTGVFFISPSLVYADWHGHGHDRGHHHSSFGINFSFWPDRYYYRRVYYPEPAYVIVNQPSYQPVVVNGATYYLNNGRYYIYTNYGYQVVPAPVQIVQTETVPVVSEIQPISVKTEAVESNVISDEQDVFTVNIPNNKGGYTAVTLKRSGSGYVGPQGEFYSEFPKVAQLRAMYGK